MEEWSDSGSNFSNSCSNYCQSGIDYRFFTIFSEAMSLNLWPNQKIDYPSGVKGQMYIPRINWGLLFFCIIVVLHFKESGKMEAAYGLSITVTMLMTTFFGFGC
jgi:KUP system potassium uptake protein